MDNNKMNKNSSFLRTCGDWILNILGFGIKTTIVTGAGLLLIFAITGGSLVNNVGGFIGKLGYATSFKWLTDNPYN